MMSNGGISLKSVLGKQSNVGFCAWEEVCLPFQSSNLKNIEFGFFDSISNDVIHTH